MMKLPGGISPAKLLRSAALGLRALTAVSLGFASSGQAAAQEPPHPFLDPAPSAQPHQALAFETLDALDAYVRSYWAGSAGQPTEAILTALLGNLCAAGSDSCSFPQLVRNAALVSVEHAQGLTRLDALAVAETVLASRRPGPVPPRKIAADVEAGSEPSHEPTAGVY